ncbi:interleukin-4 receptor subunit alpha isoform X2 [Rhinoderma darwinii]|uniref:interleukin-4 receptor subunit alpha isoform X2 n=1 Tax=Rhinoderma darwinii TaxID=43563 RepID=UPI003F66161A
MKTMTTLGLESEIIQISLIWITAIMIALSNSLEIPRIKNLDCLNDYDTKMICSWEVVNGEAKCSSDFKLKSLYCQDLDNEYDGDYRVPNKCICNINVSVIILADSYLIEVESHGQSVGKATINISSTVKPKPPTNLRVDLTEPENGVAHWKTNYEDSYIRGMLSFNIQFFSEQEGKMVLERILSQLEARYTFSKRQLTLGHDYKVRVRTKHTSDQQTKEIWSEWSPEVEFKNDYTLTILDWKRVIITVSCLVILLLSGPCYFCITRTKKKWWNNIPDPARSKLAGSTLVQKNYLKPDCKTSAGKACGKLVKAYKKSKHEQFTKELIVKDSLKLMESNMKKKCFEPEKVDIESCVHLYPREDNILNQEDSAEDKEEDIHPMDTDWSIGRMFCEILCDSPAETEALAKFNVDNTFGSFGLSILTDYFQKAEKHLPLSIVSQESGYQSYDSDDSPGDVNSRSDGPNPLCFDHSLLGQGDFLPYAPVSSITESGSQIGKEDAFVNSGYNSFASALAEATFDSVTDITEGDNISIFSLGTRFYKPNYHHSLQNPKSILYYNTRYLPTLYEDDLRPTITPTSELRVETRPTSVSEGFGYQSFHQAVQQGDTSRSTSCLESPTRVSTNSFDDSSCLSDNQYPYNESFQNNQDLLQTGLVNGETDQWNDTQSFGFHLKEFCFLDGKYPSYSTTLADEQKGLADQASDIHYGFNRTLKEADKSLALTFDISEHIRNVANMHGPDMSLGLASVGLPSNPLSFPCSLDEAPIIRDDLLDKNGLHAKCLPMKFENLSYFVPLYGDYSQTNSHLLVQQNNMDKECNSYMKIALW